MDFFRRLRSQLSTPNLRKNRPHQKRRTALHGADLNGQLHDRKHGHRHHSDAFSNSNSSQRTSSYASISSSVSPVSQLPAAILATIFGYISPHSSDETYESSEASLAGHGCPLCNTRDLAQASQVCRRWHALVQKPLYQNVRLEQVHYCGLEEELWERRNRRSFFSNADSDSNEPVKTRMRLLYRTIQENEGIAFTILYIKAPYWVREGCKQELTLLVSLVPNLRYVDLPQAVFIADSSCPLLATLKSRSSQLRLMGWESGSEQVFIHAGSEQPWKMLEVVSLSNMKIDDTQLQSVLVTLPHLRSVKLVEMAHLTDALFNSDTESMGFPLVKSLVIEQCYKITVAGIRQYILLQTTEPTLEELTLTSTGIIPDQLNSILNIALALRVLSITCEVSKPCPPLSQLPYLSSTSLREIKYEVVDSSSSEGLTASAPSYYQYLADSLCTGKLPCLKKMHANEARFNVRLRGTYTPRTRGERTTPNPVGTQQKVDIYCKGHIDVTWKLYMWICQSIVAAANEPGQATQSMMVVDMEPEKQWTSRGGLLTIPGAKAEIKESRELTKKERKRVKSKNLTDAYGAGAEYC